MKRLQFNIRRRESGATAVEYALIVGLMAAAIILALGSFSGNLSGMFNKIGIEMAKVGEPAGDGTTTDP